jgi:hypothetical protein
MNIQYPVRSRCDVELGQVHHAGWNCNARINLDQVAMIRAYRSDRGFSGSEIVFATGTPSPVVVNEDREVLLGSLVSQQKP